MLEVKAIWNIFWNVKAKWEAILTLGNTRSSFGFIADCPGLASVLFHLASMLLPILAVSSIVILSLEPDKIDSLYTSHSESHWSWHVAIYHERSIDLFSRLEDMFVKLDEYRH
jgi:hypothetical protein